MEEMQLVKPGLTREERYERIYNRIILQTYNQLQRDTERVVWLHHHYPETKGDDRLLEFRYWWRFQGMPFPVNFWDKIIIHGEPTAYFKSLTSAETLTRIRRKVQYGWGISKLLPTIEVLRKRQIRENVIQALFRGEPAPGYAKKF